MFKIFIKIKENRKIYLRLRLATYEGYKKK